MGEDQFTRNLRKHNAPFAPADKIGVVQQKVYSPLNESFAIHWLRSAASEGKTGFSHFVRISDL